MCEFITYNLHGTTATALESSSVATTGLNSWLGTVPNHTLGSVPKAYINCGYCSTHSSSLLAVAVALTIQVIPLDMQQKEKRR